MRTRISITTASLAILLATASPAHAAGDQACVLNLDTGAFSCGTASPSPMASTYVLATLSEHGVMISSRDQLSDRNLVIPSHVRSVADVSGAGDTVISVASLCLASKCTPYEVAFISNLAGGLVCEEVGVVPVNRDKLLKEVLALL